VSDALWYYLPAMMESVAYPKPWALLWGAAALAIGYLAAALALKWRGWGRGAVLPPAPRPAPGKILSIWLLEVFAQRQFLQLPRLRWAAHLCIFWGFVALTLLSLVHVALGLLESLALDGGVAAWFLRGEGRAIGKAWGNGFGLVLLVGLLLAVARRLVRPRASADESKETDLPLVLALLALTLSGFLLEALRHALASTAPEGAAALRQWLTALWTIHGLGGVALVAWLPRSGLMHAMLAPLVIALNARNEHPRRDLYWPGTAKRRATGSPQA